jgi:hypothetical protein
LLLATFISCICNSVHADNTRKAEEELRLLNESAETFRSKVLALLTLIKELEKNVPAEGPQSEDSADSLRVPERKMLNNDLLLQLAALNSDINDQYTAIKARISNLEERTSGYKTAELSSDTVKQGRINEVDGRIEKYYAYAIQFIEPYHDDVFSLVVDGRNKGDTDPGDYRIYTLNDLAPGQHEAVIIGRQTDVGGCTYGIIIREGMNELLRTADIVEINQEARYYFEVTGN